jgi:hypothetical protein
MKQKGAENMRSESLIRLDGPAARDYDNQKQRQVRADQVSEFLARGGEIQRLPSHIASKAVCYFGIGRNGKTFQYGRTGR